MEAKAKSGAAKPSSKAEKKEPAAPSKPDAAPPAEPAAPTEPEKPVEETAPDAGTAEGAEAADACADTLESLKPFLIGGAVIALGAILIGVILLAKKNWPAFTPNWGVMGYIHGVVIDYSRVGVYI